MALKNRTRTLSPWETLMVKALIEKGIKECSYTNEEAQFIHQLKKTILDAETIEVTAKVMAPELWRAFLTKAEMQLLKETGDEGISLESLKKNFAEHERMRQAETDPDAMDPCIECKIIERKLKAGGAI